MEFKPIVRDRDVRKNGHILKTCRWRSPKINYTSLREEKNSPTNFTNYRNRGGNCFGAIFAISGAVYTRQSCLARERMVVGFFNHTTHVQYISSYCFFFIILTIQQKPVNRFFFPILFFFRIPLSSRFDVSIIIDPHDLSLFQVPLLRYMQ